MRGTDEGLQIDASDEHRQKADSARVESREPASNVTIERCLQQEKQESPILVTDEGTQIEFKDEQKKKEKSQRVRTWQSGSNLIREIVLQL
jgi:hypothetical protein